MTELQRITTEYSEVEDRICLAGETGAEAGATVVLWLTQRLLNRLVPPLCQWLEAQDAPALASAAVKARHQEVGQGIAQSFAQQAASAALAPQPRVQAGSDAPQALVHSVDVTTTADRVTLRFKAQQAHDALAQVGMSAVALRQWLGMVYVQYLKAPWPTSAWPQWMEEAHRPAAAPVQNHKNLWH